MPDDKDDSPSNEESKPWVSWADSIRNCSFAL